MLFRSAFAVPWFAIMMYAGLAESAPRTWPMSRVPVTEVMQVVE